MPTLGGIKLERNIVTIQGPPDSGKSNLAKYMLTLPQYQSHLVYDPLFGFDPSVHNVIRPPSDSFKWVEYEKGNPELNHAAKLYVNDQPREKRPSYFVVDEAGSLLPHQKPMGAQMGNISMFNAHMDISLWLIFQRMAEVNSHLKNKATHHFVLGYKGENDRDALRNLHADLPAALDQAKNELGEYAFAYTGPNNSLMVFDPVPEVGAKAMV